MGRPLSVTTIRLPPQAVAGTRPQCGVVVGGPVGQAGGTAPEKGWEKDLSPGKQGLLGCEAGEGGVSQMRRHPALGPEICAETKSGGREHGALASWSPGTPFKFWVFFVVQ